ncbi:MerR family transcriptional regulator [Myxococcota bacterium]|nr:MerR family transcriptional regulator [Myxococcota bacterium]
MHKPTSPNKSVSTQVVEVETTKKSTALSPESSIPDRLYFRIGEVSLLVGVQAHVLRYWEKEISSIRPGKSLSKQRRYRYKDVETFREVKRLLYDERYTLAGAKQRLQGLGRTSSKQDQAHDVEASSVQHERGAASTAAKRAQNHTALLSESDDPQLGLGFSKTQELFNDKSSDQKAKAKQAQLRQSLNELIRMCGEEP